MPEPRTIDVADLIEHRRLDRFNYKLIVVSWLITVFDGFDQMMISFTAPYMRDQFALSKPEIGWLVSWGIAGMMAGGFLFSWVADRIGRRPTVVATAFAFGLLTLATAFARSYPQLLALRFVDGLAIGGMLPIAWALNIEFVPKRMRSTVVTMIMMGYSFGTAAAGPLTNWIAPTHGWQGVYIVGGVATLACATALLFLLPESVRFLVTRRLRPETVAVTLNRMVPGLGATSRDRFVLGDEAMAAHSFRVRQLFAGNLLRLTPLLWLGYIVSSLAVYFMSSWGPIVLEDLAFTRQTAAWVSSSGGMLGAIGGLLLMRFTDQRGPLSVAFYPALAVPVLLLAGSGLVSHDLFLPVQILSQLLVSGAHFGILSIAGVFYPSAIRASGAGWATSVAKIGGVLGPILGGYVLASGMPIVRSYGAARGLPRRPVRLRARDRPGRARPRPARARARPSSRFLIPRRMIVPELRSIAANTAVRRAQWRALGLSEEDLLKPKIAVVNSSSELAICFAHLDGVAKVVKEAIRAAGGVPFEVRTTAPSDFIVSAAHQASYILASRDLIPNDIEAQVEGAMLDGMICLTSCDKTPPGHLMAAMRLDIPTILVIGGYQASGMVDGEHVDIEDLFAGQVGASLGKAGKKPLPAMIEQAIRGPGVCAGMATANTMHCAVEALGMALPGSAPVRANSDKMLDAARRSGARIVEMVREGLTPRRIMTEGAFRNAIATVLAVSGSINAIKHLQATATEGRTGLDIFALWDEVGRQVPVLSAVRPNGEVRIEQFEDAGGAVAILKQLGALVDGDVLTCTGRTLAENMAGCEVADPDIIRPLDRPISEGPAIAILKGSLAPDSAVVKLGIRDGSRPEAFTGPARVYEEGRAVMDDLAAGRIAKGDVVVLRNQGLKGGPAMGGSASMVLFGIDAAGLAKDTAFVTDGQLSGLCLKGLTVAEVAPESAVGGPLARVQDGDRVVIDVAARQLDLDVAPEELARRKGPANEYSIPAEGWLGQYRRAVQPMSTGAVLTELDT